MTRLLTKRTVESLKVRENGHIAFDADLPGFGVRVMPSGKRFFLIQLRNSTNHDKRVHAHSLETVASALPTENDNMCRAGQCEPAHNVN